MASKYVRTLVGAQVACYSQHLVQNAALQKMIYIYIYIYIYICAYIHTYIDLFLKSNTFRCRPEAPRNIASRETGSCVVRCASRVMRRAPRLITYITYITYIQYNTYNTYITYIPYIRCMCRVSCVRCRISCVMHNVPNIMCRVPCTMCHVSCIMCRVSYEV